MLLLFYLSSKNNLLVFFSQVIQAMWVNEFVLFSWLLEGTIKEDLVFATNSVEHDECFNLTTSASNFVHAHCGEVADLIPTTKNFLKEWQACKFKYVVKEVQNNCEKDVEGGKVVGNANVMGQSDGDDDIGESDNNLTEKSG